MDNFNNNNNENHQVNPCYNENGIILNEGHEICFGSKLGNGPNNFIDMDDMVTLRKSACQIKTKEGYATGVFCYFFKLLMYCLITCEHVITEKMIQNKEQLIIIYNEINKKGRIAKEISLDKREIFYFIQDYDADITIVELFPDDGVEKERFLEPFYLKENENLKDTIKKNIFILLQHPAKAEYLKVDAGNITKLDEDNISFEHKINTLEGSSGGPLLYKDNKDSKDNKNNKNKYYIFGIHNKGIIKNVKDKEGKSQKEKTNKGSVLYKVLDKLNKKIIYNIKEKGKTRIFGELFVTNNKNNIELFINRERHDLDEFYYFDKTGYNEIFIIEDDYITDMSYMFAECKSTVLLDSFKNWDLSKVQKMSYMFFRCEFIESLEGLKNWDVSNVKNMSGLFYECTSLKSVESLSKWNVTNVEDMSYMFSGCNLIESLEGLRNWIVSKIEDFSYMFKDCGSIKSVEPLKNWSIANANNIESMFLGCKSIKTFDAIDNWRTLTRIFSIDNITTKPWLVPYLID